VVCQKQIKDKKYENLILNDCYSQLKVWNLIKFYLQNRNRFWKWEKFSN